MDVALATGLYRIMLRIRRAEERIPELYAAGKMPGFIHLSIGQEAVAAGACAPLRRDDCVTSPHRGTATTLAKGGWLPGLFAELYGKATGCRGPFHEALNLAAVWTLPVVFVCENNWWASTTAFADATGGRLDRRACRRLTESRGRRSTATMPWRSPRRRRAPWRAPEG